MNAAIYGYVPTVEWLLNYARVKKLARFNPNDVSSTMNAVVLALQHIVVRARLGDPITHVRIVKRNGIPRHAIVLRNNWEAGGAKDKHIIRIKNILGTEQDPGWFSLYCQNI
ncbi:hypothetical protein QCA50_006450 [Cerrena zonata]|uniref:Uncharacterized protein n=1 Tax=Cerrena zonata TaxID=2478898 RepID=A0AAW0G8X6_9APHY